MKASNRTAQLTERHYYHAHMRQPSTGQPNTVDLSLQERRALSLVWSEAAEERQQGAPEADTEHCAVLGYN